MLLQNADLLACTKLVCKLLKQFKATHVIRSFVQSEISSGPLLGTPAMYLKDHDYTNQLFKHFIYRIAHNLGGLI